MCSILRRLTLTAVVLLPAALASQATVSAADPRKLGPYAVGVRTEVFVDAGRTCAVTKRPRTLVTEIWYPAAEGSEKLPVNKFSEFWVNENGKKVGRLAINAFGGKFDELEKNFENIAHRNAEMHEGNFPLLIFSHGNGGLRHQNTFQAEYLASHGYVVAAPDHTGNAAITVLPDQVVPYNEVTREPERRDDRPHDVSFLVTHLLSLSDGNNHWLHGKLDADKVGVFGHSYGGFTACRVTELDPRVKATIPMTFAATSIFDKKKEQEKSKGENSKSKADAPKLASGKIANGKNAADKTASTAGGETKAEKKDDEPIVFKGPPCKIPLMVLLGDADRTVKEPGNKLSTSYYEHAVGPKYLLNFKGAGHFTFTEMRQTNPNFGDGIGVDKDKKSGKVKFTFSDAKEAQRITNEYSVAFFDTFLRNDAEARKYLDANQYPTVVAYSSAKGAK